MKADAAMRMSGSSGKYIQSSGKRERPLTEWFIAIYGIAAVKRGYLAMQLSRDIEISCPAVWLMMHKIREAIKNRDEDERLKYAKMQIIPNVKGEVLSDFAGRSIAEGSHVRSGGCSSRIMR